MCSMLNEINGHKEKLEKYPIPVKCEVRVRLGPAHLFTHLINIY